MRQLWDFHLTWHQSVLSCLDVKYITILICSHTVASILLPLDTERTFPVDASGQESQHEISMWQVQNKPKTILHTVSTQVLELLSTGCGKCWNIEQVKINQKTQCKERERKKKKKSWPTKQRTITFVTAPGLRMVAAWEDTTLFLPQFCILAQESSLNLSKTKCGWTFALLLGLYIYI